MTQAQAFLCAAANVEVPAYLVLSQKDYTVTAPGNDSWYAEKDGLRFQAESLIELLGLVSMYENSRSKAGRCGASASGLDSTGERLHPLEANTKFFTTLQNRRREPGIGPNGEHRPNLFTT
jgi:hypothetical protein